jgi:hypothetical protein
VKYIIEQTEFANFTAIADIPCFITSIQEISDVGIDDAKSEYYYQMFMIKGVFSSVKN